MCYKWFQHGYTFNILCSINPGPWEILMIFYILMAEVSHVKLLSWDLTVDKSTLVHVMDHCHQATGHNLSQCWPRSLSPYGITRPQWVIGTSYNGMTQLSVEFWIWPYWIDYWFALKYLSTSQTIFLYHENVCKIADLIGRNRSMG